MSTKNKPDNSSPIKPYHRLVALPVHSENIFHFPDGLPAFEYVKEFVIMHKPDTTPFLFMHSLEPTGISFVCIDPFSINPDYQPRISHADLSFLHAENSDEILLLSIVTVTPRQEDITANLQGPIAINMQGCIAKQIILDGCPYPVRYRIWDALNDIKSTAEQPQAAAAS